MTFEAEVTGDPAVTNGIFTCQSGVVQPIVVQGQPKPGTAAVFGINPSDRGMLLLASLLGGLGMLWHARSGRGAG